MDLNKTYVSNPIVKTVLYIEAIIFFTNLRMNFLRLI